MYLSPAASPIGLEEVGSLPHPQPPLRIAERGIEKIVI
jgi:hypothetical protein